MLYHLATLDELASIWMNAQKFATLFLKTAKCKAAPLCSTDVKFITAAPNAVYSAAGHKGAQAMQRGSVAGSRFADNALELDTEARFASRRPAEQNPESCPIT